MCVFHVCKYLKYIGTYARMYVRMCVMYVRNVCTVFLSKVCDVCGFEGGSTPTAIMYPSKIH